MRVCSFPLANVLSDGWMRLMRIFLFEYFCSGWICCLNVKWPFCDFAYWISLRRICTFPLEKPRKLWIWCPWNPPQSHAASDHHHPQVPSTSNTTPLDKNPIKRNLFTHPRPLAQERTIIERPPFFLQKMKQISWRKTLDERYEFYTIKCFSII